MRPLMRQVQDRYVRELLGEELDTQLRSKENITDEHERKLFDYACKFIANKTAELYTSENSIRNKSSIDRTTYDQHTRPVYFDLQNTGNFYADQAQFYYGKLERAYNDYLVAAGKSPATAVMDWNTDEKKLFIDGRLPQYEFNGHSLLEEYLSFKKEGDSRKKLDEYGIDLVLYKNPEKLKLYWWEKYLFMVNEDKLNDNRDVFRDYLLTSPEWQEVFADKLSRVFVRSRPGRGDLQ
jgi:hypothetical protein